MGLKRLKSATKNPNFFLAEISDSDNAQIRSAKVEQDMEL
jgi:hypothetical protein